MSVSIQWHRENFNIPKIRISIHDEGRIFFYFFILGTSRDFQRTKDNLAKKKFRIPTIFTAVVLTAE